MYDGLIKEDPENFKYGKIGKSVCSKHQLETSSLGLIWRNYCVKRYEDS